MRLRSLLACLLVLPALAAPAAGAQGSVPDSLWQEYSAPAHDDLSTRAGADGARAAALVAALTVAALAACGLAVVRVARRREARAVPVAVPAPPEPAPVSARALVAAGARAARRLRSRARRAAPGGRRAGGDRAGAGPAGPKPPPRRSLRLGLRARARAAGAQARARAAARRKLALGDERAQVARELALAELLEREADALAAVLVDQQHVGNRARSTPRRRRPRPRPCRPRSTGRCRRSRASRRRTRRRCSSTRSARRPTRASDPYPRPDDLSYRGRTRHAQGAAYEHSAYVLLIDKHGRQRVGFPFEQLSERELARDLRALVAER